MSRSPWRRIAPGVYERTNPGGARVYQVRWYDAHGIRRAATFDTRQEAMAFKSAMDAERARGGLADLAGARVTFGELWEHHVATRASRSTTIGTEDAHARNHLLPRWGDIPVAAIRQADIQQWVAKLSGSIAPATVVRVFGVFRLVLNEAVPELIPHNPARGVKLPRPPSTEARFLTPEELLAIERAIASSPPRSTNYHGGITGEQAARQPRWWSLIVPFCADTGLRIGEVSALRVRHLDLLRGTVQVEENATYASIPGVGRRRHVGEPKTARGRRVVPTLTPAVAERIAEMIAERGLGPDDLLFCGPQGGPLNPNNWRSRVWNPAVERCGLPDPQPTPHSLRHTTVAHWIAAGADIYKIARWCGHRGIGQIERVYGHLLPQDESGVRKALEHIREAANRQQPEVSDAGGAKVISMSKRRYRKI